MSAFSLPIPASTIEAFRKQWADAMKNNTPSFRMPVMMDETVLVHIDLSAGATCEKTCPTLINGHWNGCPLNKDQR